nr:RluA family pseudouridine synthase [Amphibacillus jilinensis]
MILRDFLRMCVGLSRNMIKVLKYDGGKILLNGQTVNVRERLATGDQIELQFPKEERGPQLIPEPINLDIVYEDEFLIVVNKPAKMATIPSTHHRSKTVANGLIAHYDQLDLDYTVHVVTRLDRDTSGLMLIAKQRFCHSFFHQQKIERHYQAVVEGKPEKTAGVGVIDAPIARKPDSIIERTVSKGGKPAVTHYQVIRHVKCGSIVDIKLETGRTHQIRVHFAHIGHPLVGDKLYGGSTVHVDRQALHCVYLSFIHPITKKRIQLKSDWPADLSQITDCEPQPQNGE